ncbi:MAG: hypothetical protein ACO4CS_03880 [bacterium]
MTHDKDLIEEAINQVLALAELVFDEPWPNQDSVKLARRVLKHLFKTKRGKHWALALYEGDDRMAIETCFCECIGIVKAIFAGKTRIADVLLESNRWRLERMYALTESNVQKLK